MSYLKEQIFRPSSSSMLRSGVMLNYAAEDTMRSMLREFGQSNQQDPVSRMTNNNNVAHFEKTMNPAQLNALNDCSDSDYEEEEDDDVKHLTEKYNQMLNCHSTDEDNSDFYEDDYHKPKENLNPNGLDDHCVRLHQTNRTDRKTVKFDLNVAAISNSYNFDSTQQTSDSINLESLAASYFESNPRIESPSHSEQSTTPPLCPRPDVESTHPDSDSCNNSPMKQPSSDSFDYSLPNPQDQVCVGEGKSFEQMLEDQLKLESKNIGTFPAELSQQKPKSSDSSSRLTSNSAIVSAPKPRSANSASQSPNNSVSNKTNQRKPFLRKNHGLGAWNAKSAISAGVVGKKKKSLDFSSGNKVADNSRTSCSSSQGPNNNKISPKTTGHVRKTKSPLTSTLPAKFDKSSVSASHVKWSPVSNGSHDDGSSQPKQPFNHSNSTPQLSASLSHEGLSENELEELEEFELLEQVADCSFASSISTVANLDKGSLKQRLLRTAPSVKSGNAQQTNGPQLSADRHTHGPSHPAVTSDDDEKENSTPIQGRPSSDQPIARPVPHSAREKQISDESSQSELSTTARPRKVASLLQNRNSIPSVNQYDHRFSTSSPRNFSDDEDEENEQDQLSWKSTTPRPRMFDDEACWEDIDSGKTKARVKSKELPHDAPDVDLELTERSEFDSSSSLKQLNVNNVPSQQDFFNMASGVFPVFRADQSKADPQLNPAVQSLQLKEWIGTLESEIKRFNHENAALASMKKEKEEAMKRMESEMKAFEEFKEKSQLEFEEYKEMEIKKLKKERKVFEDYQRALKTMPNKKDREEIDRLKQELAESREECAAKDSRWQSANNRLRARIEQLEVEKSELQQRVKLLEQKKLELQSQVSTLQTKVTSSQDVNKQSRPSLDSVTQSVTFRKAPTVPQPVTPRYKPTSLGSARDGPLSPRNHSLKEAGSEESVGLCGTVRASTASDYYTGEEEVYSDRGVPQEKFRPRVSVETSSGYQLTAAQAKSIREYSGNHPKGSMKKEVQHQDGMLERLHTNGSIEIFYPNGSVKEISADGKSTTVNLYNGDVKQTLADGRTIYYYAEEQIIQTTYPDGLEEIQHKDGRKEVIRDNGVHETYFPDKTIKYVHPNREEETVYANGMIVRVSAIGEKEIILTNGQKEIHKNGCKSRIYPDGTTKTVFPDGRQETRYASGRIRIKDKDGNLIVDTKSSGPVLGTVQYAGLSS